MPRPCTVCRHPDRHAIDGALLARESFRNIAGRFGTSLAALHRHRHGHLAAAAATVVQLTPEQELALAVQALAARIQELREQIEASRRR